MFIVFGNFKADGADNFEFLFGLELEVRSFDDALFRYY